MNRKPQTSNTRRTLTVVFPHFHPFEFVSDFGFRISNFSS